MQSLIFAIYFEFTPTYPNERGPYKAILIAVNNDVLPAPFLPPIRTTFLLLFSLVRVEIIQHYFIYFHLQSPSGFHDEAIAD